MTARRPLAVVSGQIEELPSGDTVPGDAIGSHTHVEGDVTSLVSDLAGKANATHTHAESDVTSLVSDLAGKQPLDSDLTAIAGLSPTNDDVIQRKAGAWTNRTMAQLKTDLAVTASDVGAVPTSRTVSAGTGLTGGGDLTANRTLALSLVPTPPVTLTYASPLAVDASAGNYRRCALTGSPTLNLPTSGTDGQRLLLELTAASAQVVTFHASYKRLSYIDSTLSIGVGKVGWVGLIYNGTDWTVLSAGVTG